jgi:hypothetical protein
MKIVLQCRERARCTYNGAVFEVKKEIPGRKEHSMHSIPGDANKCRARVVRGTKISTKVLALLLSGSLLAYGKGNTFTKVRYNGGSVASKVDPKDWNNKMTVTPDAITMDFKDGQKVVIPPKSVTSLSYGQEAHRRVGTMVALAILIAPVALFGLFHKTRLHYIGIQYNTPDGKNAGILLQGDKDNYRAMLVALQGVTGAPVSVGEKERGFIPVGVTTTVAKDTGEGKAARPAPAANAAPAAANPAPAAASPEPSTPSAPPAETTGTVKTDNAGGGLGNVVTNGSNTPRSGEATAEISSDPLGADIEIDGSFVGSTPSSVGIVAGEHTLRISKNGYKRWERTLKSSTGSIKIAAVLEPTLPAGPAVSKDDSPRAIASSTSTTRDSEAASTPTAGLPEDLIGVWFTGNPTVRHDGIEVAGVQPKGPAANIDMKPGDVIIAIDGHFLVTIDELRAELLRHALGKPLAIRYRHGRLTSENYLILGSKDTIPQR